MDSRRPSRGREEDWEQRLELLGNFSTTGGPAAGFGRVATERCPAAHVTNHGLSLGTPKYKELDHYSGLVLT